MKIRRQLHLSAWICGTLVLVIFVTLFLFMRQVDLALEKSTFAGDINTNGISGLRTVTVDYIVSPQQRAEMQWQQRHASLRALLAGTLYEGTAEQGIVERLRLRNEYLGDVFPKFTAMYAERRGKPERNSLQREVEARLLTQIMVATQDMVFDANQLMHRSHERLARAQNHANVIVSAAVALMALFIVVVLVLAARNILKPIGALQRGTEIISGGDLTHRTQLTLDNEIGALSRSFDAMTAQLAQSRSEQEANAWRLQESVQELESFSYSVSHDLRAPLRGIDGWSLALQEDYADKLDQTGRGYLDIVRAETQRMGQLIEDLLQLSRVTRGELRRESVDVSALALSIANRLRAADPQSRIEFQIEPGLAADADSRLLEIALTNLIGNACKFSGTQPLARVELSAVLKQDAESKAQRKVFFVRDNGVGFDLAHAAKLFGAFQRLHAATEFPGTGIGLATVQRIVRRHGGRIWAEAQPGRGATFHFTLEGAA